MILTIAKPQQFQAPSDYYDGEFDAAIALPPKSQNPEYLRGYVAYTLKTGNVPF